MRIKADKNLAKELSCGDILFDVDWNSDRLNIVMEKSIERYISNSLRQMEKDFCRVVARELKDIDLEIYGDGSLKLCFVDNYAPIGYFNLIDLIKEQIEFDGDEDNSYLDACIVTFNKIIKVINDEKNRREKNAQSKRNVSR